MSTAEERFETLVKHVESVTEVLKDLQDMGLYGQMEYSAGVALMTTFERALKVLDPDKANKYLADTAKEMIAQSKAKTNPLEELMKLMGGDKQDTGLYL